MRIGIILHPYDEDKPAGLARTIFELTKGMLEVDSENEYIVYLKQKPRAIPELPRPFRVEILGGGRLWLEKLRTVAKADVYIFNTPIMPFFWKPPHSVIIALDFAYWYLLPKTIAGQARKWVTFLMHAITLRRADTIIAISEATKKDVRKLFKIPSERIKVVHCGFKKICEVPHANVPLPDKFFFFAGIIKPRKNVFNIVKAFHIFSRSHHGYSLVIGGNGSGEYCESIRAYVRENNLEEKVLFLGHLNDAELSCAYSRAEAFVFPTLIEGFGYPVLEAMDCGIPVITSNQSSLSEIAGDAALLVNPYDAEDIARAMQSIAREDTLRARLIALGVLRAARFSWTKAGRAMLHEIGALPHAVSHKRQTIFITLIRGLLVRNFFYSGVIPMLLQRGFRVIVLVPHYWDLSDFSSFLRENLVFERMPPPQEPRFKKFFEEFSKGAVFNETVQVRYRYRFAGKEPVRALYFARMLFFAPLKFVPFFKTLLRFVECAFYPEYQCDYLFRTYAPALVFNTAAGQNFSVLKAARRFSIPTIDMPKSWDNASKLLFRVKADYIFAWGPFMAEQIVRYQGYHPREVVLTGVPQFDYYVAKRGVIPREEFFKKFNFDPAKKLILYISPGGNCCDETDYLELLKQYMETGAITNAQVLIRPHLKYIGGKNQFTNFEKISGFAVDATGVQNTTARDNWDISEAHLAHLANSLCHAAVCITIGSTIMLDAAACGTPSVNIAFDIKKDISQQRSVKRFFLSDYLQAAIKTGGTVTVESSEEFLRSLRRLLENGARDPSVISGRERLIQHIMYKNDGCSNKRVVQAIEEVLLKANL